MRLEEKLGGRMLEILRREVSTRHYRAVLPETEETVGVSRSSVSREAIEASEQELRRLCERRLDELELLILYFDGVIFGEHQCWELPKAPVRTIPSRRVFLGDLVQRGLQRERKYLFVIDGAKLLRAAIDAVFGVENLVQRCRQHKVETMVGYLPEELKEQAGEAVLR
jgi:putative transposase